MNQNKQPERDVELTNAFPIMDLINKFGMTGCVIVFCFFGGKWVGDQLDGIPARWMENTEKWMDLQESNSAALLAIFNELNIHMSYIAEHHGKQADSVAVMADEIGKNQTQIFRSMDESLQEISDMGGSLR